MTIQVPKPQFQKLDKLYAAMKIMERKEVELTTIQLKKICITGGCYSDGGYVYLNGWEAVPLEKYKESLAPLEYRAHNEDVDAGNRRRGYDGMKIKSDGAWWVLTGTEITLKPIDAGSQLSIF